MAEERESVRDMIDRQAALRRAQMRSGTSDLSVESKSGLSQRSASGVGTFLRLAVLAFLAAYSWSMGQIPAAGLNGFGKFISGLFFVAAPVLYFLPTIEGRLRKQPNIVSIALVNLLLGWTLVGWVVAMAWACAAKREKSVEFRPADSAVVSTAPRAVASPLVGQSVADELRKLADLKEQGILTEEEFAAQKVKALAR
ncbi:superinfection immunity protein [Achromobacter xylosoxidans]|uniref:superinfection immunity protein n=1 Tax=Alcaligenes xylosoxydans xylosoxydans TaxID=85698 RepID=UPI001C9E3510|nr:superinfection immunity protein [Achromobacter xylosoxidans]